MSIKQISISNSINSIEECLLVEPNHTTVDLSFSIIYPILISLFNIISKDSLIKLKERNVLNDSFVDIDMKSEFKHIIIAKKLLLFKLKQADHNNGLLDKNFFSVTISTILFCLDDYEFEKAKNIISILTDYSR